MTSLPVPSQPTLSLRTFVARNPLKLQLVIAVVIYATVSLSMLQASGVSQVRFRFDASALLAASTVLQVHVVGAISTFAIGCCLLSGRKGGGLHRTFGYMWMVTMTLTADSSFFLTGLNGNSYSPIHALSAWTIIFLPIGLAAARRGNIAAHRKHMTSLFTGGMAIAGLFTFLPGRMMWNIFFAV